MSDDRWNGTITAWRLHETSPRGRPKTRWADSMNAFLTKLTGQQHSDDDWRSTACCSATWLALKADYIDENNIDEDSIDEDNLAL